MVQKMKEVVDYLKENYEACADLCGENDEVNTMPAKDAYEKALNVYVDMTKGTKV